MTRAVEPLTDAEREAFVAAARSYIGVRWKHQGRTRNGLDCAGLIVVALRDIGRTPVDMVGYPAKPYRGMLQAAAEANFGPSVPLPATLRPGDVVLFQVGKAAPNHVGIIANGKDGLNVVHAHAPDVVVMESRIPNDWWGKIVGVYR